MGMRNRETFFVIAVCSKLIVYIDDDNCENCLIIDNESN